MRGSLGREELGEGEGAERELGERGGAMGRRGSQVSEMELRE